MKQNMNRLFRLQVIRKKIWEKIWSKRPLSPILVQRWDKIDDAIKQTVKDSK